MMSHFFFLAAFKYSICLCLLEVLLSLDVYIFEFILLYVELFGYVDSCLLLNLGSVWPLFLQIFFLTLSLSALLIPIMCVGLLHYCPQTPLGSVHFFFFHFFFFLFLRLDNFNVYLQFSDSIFFLLNMLLNFSRVFHFSYCTF